MKESLKNLSKEELKAKLSEMSYEDIVRDENTLEIALNSKAIPFKIVEAGVKKNDQKLINALINFKYHPGEETILASGNDETVSKLINAFYPVGSLKLPFITKLSNLSLSNSLMTAISKLNDTQISVDILKMVESADPSAEFKVEFCRKIVAAKNLAVISYILNEKLKIMSSVAALLVLEKENFAKPIKDVAAAITNPEIENVDTSFFGKDISINLRRVRQREVESNPEQIVMQALYSEFFNTGYNHTEKDNVTLAQADLLKLLILMPSDSFQVCYHPSFEALAKKIEVSNVAFDYVPPNSILRKFFISKTEKNPSDLTEEEALVRISRSVFKRSDSHSDYLIQYAATNKNIAAYLVNQVSASRTIVEICGRIKTKFGAERASQAAANFVEAKKTFRKALLPFLPETAKNTSLSRKKQWYVELNEAIDSKNFDAPITADKPGIRAILERYSITQYIQAKVSDKRLSHSVRGDGLVDFISQTPLTREDALAMIKSPFSFSLKVSDISNPESPLYADIKDKGLFEYLDLLERDRMDFSTIAEFLIDRSRFNMDNLFIQYISHEDFNNKKSAHNIFFEIEKFTESDCRAIIKLFANGNLDKRSMGPSDALSLIKYMNSSTGPEVLVKLAKDNDDFEVVAAKFEDGKLLLSDKEAVQKYCADYYESILLGIQKSGRPPTGAINSIAKKEFSSLFDELVYSMNHDKTDPLKKIMAHFGLPTDKIRVRTERSKRISHSSDKVPSIFAAIKNGEAISSEDHNTLVKMTDPEEIKDLNIKVSVLDFESTVKGPIYSFDTLKVKSYDSEIADRVAQVKKLKTFYEEARWNSDGISKEQLTKLLPLLGKAEEISCSSETAAVIIKNWPDLGQKIVEAEKYMKADGVSLGAKIELARFFFPHGLEEIIKEEVFNVRPDTSRSLEKLKELCDTDLSGIEHLFYSLPVSDDCFLDKRVAELARKLKFVRVSSDPYSWVKYYISKNPTDFKAVGFNDYEFFLKGAVHNKIKMDLMEFVVSLDPRCKDIVAEYCSNFSLSDLTHLRNFDEMTEIVASLNHKKMAGYTKQPWFKEKCKPGYLRVANIISKLQQVCGENLDLGILFENLSEKGAEGWSKEVLALEGDESAINGLVDGVKNSDFNKMRTQDLAKFVLINGKENDRVIRDAFHFVGLAKNRITETIEELNEAKDLINAGKDASEILDGYSWIDGLEESIDGNAGKEKLIGCIDSGLKTVDDLAKKYVSILNLRDVHEIHDEANSIITALSKSRGNYSLNQKRLKKLSTKKDAVTDDGKYSLLVPQKCSELVSVSTKYGWCTRNSGTSYHEELKKGNACILWICQGEPSVENVTVQFYVKRNNQRKFDLSSLQAMYPNNSKSATDNFDFKKIIGLINKADDSSPDQLAA